MIDVEMLRPTADEMLSGLSANEAMKQRILLKAQGVDRLGEVATEMLGGLSKTPSLRHRILVAAEHASQSRSTAVAPEPKPARRRPALARFTPALGMALVLAVMIGIGANYGKMPDLLDGGLTPPVEQGIGTFAAGSGGQGGAVPQFRSLYAPSTGANPPIIGINGRFYQMLNVPVSQNHIGTEISEIQDHTDEPALAKTVGTMSNVVEAGKPVYSVDGISTKTACIAEVDGTLRLFQRVGYASGSTVGNESYNDMLDVYGRVTALELSGVGRIDDESKANELIYTLSEFSNYHGNDITNSGQALTIYLSNGLSLQLMVDGDILSGCGAWSCPEFFDAFNAAVGTAN